LKIWIEGCQGRMVVIQMVQKGTPLHMLLICKLKKQLNILY